MSDTLFISEKIEYEYNLEVETYTHWTTHADTDDDIYITIFWKDKNGTERSCEEKELDVWWEDNFEEEKDTFHIKCKIPESYPITKIKMRLQGNDGWRGYWVQVKTKQKAYFFFINRWIDDETDGREMTLTNPSSYYHGK